MTDKSRIPEAVIEAASILQPTAEVRASRVILALAESLPEDAVKAAREAYWVTWNSASNGVEAEAAMDDAIAAFLKHVVGFDERTWCSDPQEPCDECGKHWVEFVHKIDTNSLADRKKEDDSE